MGGKVDNIEVKLTHRQRVWADEFLIHGNATLAAERAGYSPGGAAEVAGFRLKKNPKVKAYLASKTQVIYDKLEITFERVMKQYARLAFSDTRELYNEDGTLKEVPKLDEDMAAAVQGVEIEIKKGHRGKSPTQTAKIKLADRKAALDSICKIKGWTQPSGDDGVVVNVVIKKGGKDAGNKH